MPATLDRVDENRKAKVIDIQGGAGIRQRLSQMGIHPGDIVTMLRYGALRGSLLIEIHWGRPTIDALWSEIGKKKHSWRSFSLYRWPSCRPLQPVFSPVLFFREEINER